MAGQDCIFCKIVAGEIPAAKLYEDADVLAFLDVGPLREGHTLVIPKMHVEKVHECPPEVLGKVAAAIVPISRAVAETVQADGYNVLCNNGRAAGQLVGHLHFHVIPRNDGDGVFNSWPAKKYAQGRAEEVAQSIREKL